MMNKTDKTTIVLIKARFGFFNMLTFLGRIET